VDVALILLLIVVAKSEVGLHTHVLRLFCGEIEGENVVLEELLSHHLIEDWRDSFLSQCWVGHSNDSLKVLAVEDCSLLLNETKLLIFNMDLTTRFSIARSDSNVVGQEVTSEGS